MLNLSIPFMNKSIKTCLFIDMDTCINLNYCIFSATLGIRRLYHQRHVTRGLSLEDPYE